MMELWRNFISAFVLTWRALNRAFVPLLLLVGVALVYVLLPPHLHSDGTAGGMRELFLRAVPGAIWLLTLVSVLACACGFYANEREARRLPLTLVRPASGFIVALGKWAALVVLSGLVLGASAVCAYFMVPGARPHPQCNVHIAPALPPAIESAKFALDEYLANPETPEAVRRAPKDAVLALLATKELERYDTVPPKATAAWPFNLPSDAQKFTLRVRFSTLFNMRSPVSGVFKIGELTAVVSNNTQSIIDLPLVATTNAVANPALRTSLTFQNTATDAMLLRPRRDLEILTPADSFGANLCRATLEMLGLIAVCVAFGLFLSAALSRPVSLFTSLVLLIVMSIAPSVIQQYPDEFGAAFKDKIGLWMSRAVYSMTEPLTTPSPLTFAATDTCITYYEFVRVMVMDFIVLPAVLLLGAAYFSRRTCH